MLKNTILLHNDYAEIIVESFNKRNIYKHSVLIDIEDISKVGKIRISKTGYVYHAKRGCNSITCTILGVKTDNKKYIDHINGNTLDNRKSNLRICNSSENARNRHSFTRNNTGVVGIAYREKDNYKYFRVSLTNLNGKRYSKHFNINKLGKDKAFKFAQKHLLEKKKEFGYI